MATAFPQLFYGNFLTVYSIPHYHRKVVAQFSPCKPRLLLKSKSLEIDDYSFLYITGKTLCLQLLFFNNIVESFDFVPIFPDFSIIQRHYFRALSKRLGRLIHDNLASFSKISILGLVLMVFNLSSFSSTTPPLSALRLFFSSLSSRYRFSFPQTRC